MEAVSMSSTFIADAEREVKRLRARSEKVETWRKGWRKRW
jgi:hypothetical protein